MHAKLKTAVVGATGYAGMELARLLLRHPQVDPPLLLRRETDNKGPSSLADISPVFSGGA